MSDNETKREELFKNWVEFFAEFRFDLNPRFFSTIVNQATPDAVKEYITGYFRITGDPESDAIGLKCESDAAKDLFARTASMRPASGMNARLDIFYSRFENGCDDLTMKALGLLPDAETVYGDYDTGDVKGLFRESGVDGEGNPASFDTPLAAAMKNGSAVILEHINLLSLACQQELRSVTDERSSVTIGGEEYHIKPGFRIVATMNLLVDRQVKPLSPWLANRASTIREFESDPETMASLVF